MRFSIPAKFLAVSVLTLAITGAVAGAGLWISESLGGRLARSANETSALKNHLTADMMHDALRGDVLAAIDATVRGDAEAKQVVLADLDEHATVFLESVAANRALPLSQAVQEPLAKVEGPLKEYLASATGVINELFATGTRNAAALATFRTAFESLETEMAVVSDAIEKTVAESQAEGAADSHLAEGLMFGALGLAIAFSIGLFLFTSTGIARPLVRISRALAELASNKADVAIPYAGRSDEIGDLASTAYAFHKAQQEQLAREKEQRERDEAAARQARETQAAAEEAERARADAQRQREEEAARASRSEALRGLANMFERRVSDVIEKVDSSTARLGGLANQLNDGAHQADERSTELVDATTRAASGVETVATAADRLSAAVSEISQQVEGSRSLSTNAVSEVEKASEVVSGLAAAARKIGDVVGLINDIAAQTNLLALNATIEAARAGAVGKGFAVVASEVKMLANQTAKATEDVSLQVDAIRASSDEVVAVISQVKKTIDEMNASTGAISQAVDQQGSSTEEIMRQVGQMNGDTKSMSSNATLVAHAVEQTRESATAVHEASNEMRKLTVSLRDQVDNFVAELKSA